MDRPAFPSNEYEALAMLYIRNQDSSHMTPEELWDLYEKTYLEIMQYAKSKQDASVDYF